LGTKNFIIRNYKNSSGESIELYVISSQGNWKISLPPELTLPNLEATITDKSPLQITDSIEATRLLIEKEFSWELAAYWYKIGKFNTSIYFSQQLKVAINMLLGKRTPVALIRVSTVMENNKQDIALGRIKAFCVILEPLLNKYIP
jgi:EpsI family protein